MMVTLPVLSYYVCERVLFAHKQNPDNWAAVVAIIVTNLIVGGYCYTAYIEDSDAVSPDDARKGVVPPRVGVFKERTD